MKARKLTPNSFDFSQEQLQFYAQRLQPVIRCKTVSVRDSYDDTEFAKLRAVMEQLFPLVHANAERMTFSEDCWVYKLAGKDSSRNIMLMSHHDVFSANGPWQHDPFGGEISQGQLWGRGTVDTKTPLFAEFSALEEMLKAGEAFPCNIWIGSSHNEELGGDGIPKALEYFKEQGISFEVILDEGGAIIDPPLGGMKCEKCAMVAVHEKGRYYLDCTATAATSHTGITSASSSSPAERMASFIHEITTGNLFIRRLNPQVKAMLSHLAPYCGFPMKQILGNLWLFGGILEKVMPKINAQAGAMIGTTCCFYNVSGDQLKCTTTAVLKSVDSADMEKDIAVLKTVAEKYGITVTKSPRSEYHEPADMSKPPFAYTMGCISEVFPQYPAAPMILPAGTDARTLTDICPCVLRFAPITLTKEQLAGVHSEEERISLTAIAEAVVFYKHFIRNYP